MNNHKHRIFNYSILIIALIFTIAPFLYLAQYNHPSADDFCYARTVNYLGFINSQIDHYLTWSGRYSATALLSMITVDHNDLFNYRIIPILLIISFIISIFVFFKALVRNASAYDIGAITFIILFLFILKAPNITEAFFWLAGSITYQLASILTLFLFTLILYLLRQDGSTPNILLIIAGTITGITIVGLNEVSLIYVCAILLLWISIRFNINRKAEGGMVFIIFITCIAAAISLLAPGNYERMSTVKAEQFNLFFSISGSLQLTIWAVISWLPLLGLLILIFWDTFLRIGLQTKSNSYFKLVSWKIIILSIIILFGFLLMGYFPMYWSQGGRPPTRTINLILLLFIIGGLGIVLMIFIRIIRSRTELLKIPLFIPPLAGLILISYLILNPNNIKNAYKDILSGKAAKYDQEMELRFSLLEKCEEGLCNIPLLKNRPSTLLAYDLALDPDEKTYYYNTCLNDYIHKTYSKETNFPPKIN